MSELSDDFKRDLSLFLEVLERQGIVPSELGEKQKAFIDEQLDETVSRLFDTLDNYEMGNL